MSDIAPHVIPYINLVLSKGPEGIAKELLRLQKKIADAKAVLGPMSKAYEILSK